MLPFSSTPITKRDASGWPDRSGKTRVVLTTFEAEPRGRIITKVQRGVERWQSTTYKAWARRRDVLEEMDNRGDSSPLQRQRGRGAIALIAATSLLFTVSPEARSLVDDAVDFIFADPKANNAAEVPLILSDMAPAGGLGMSVTLDHPAA